jgi:mRNA-degrading endonuclease YafQ of YafQ-DinJ toxin-antitoxin module
VKEKIKEFRDKNNHKKLKVHKLHAELKDFWSCSVNYKIRIVFYWNDKKTVWLEAIGGHDIYK